MRPKKSGGLGSIYVGGVRFNFDVAQKHQCAELVTVNVTVNFGALGANRTSQVPFRRPDASDQEHKPFPQSAINETLGVLKMDLVLWTRTFYLPVLHEKPRVADV